MRKLASTRRDTGYGHNPQLDSRLPPMGDKGSFGELFKPSDRINYGLTLVAGVAVVFLEGQFILQGVALILGATLAAEPFLSRRFQMSPAMALGAICVVGLAIAVIWQITANGQLPKIRY